MACSLDALRRQLFWFMLIVLTVLCRVSLCQQQHAAIIAIPFETLPTIAPSSSWHAEGVVLHNDGAVAFDGSPVTLRIQSSMPMHRTLSSPSSTGTDRVFALSLTYARESRKDVNPSHACTAGPMMHSIPVAQLTFQGPSQWMWDIPLATSSGGDMLGQHGYVDNHGNDLGGLEFSSIPLHPGRYFVCTALETLEPLHGDDGNGQQGALTRRLIPVAYFDVRGWLGGLDVSQRNGLSIEYSLHGWFPASHTVLTLKGDREGTTTGSPTSDTTGTDDADRLSLLWRLDEPPVDGATLEVLPHQVTARLVRDARTKTKLFVAIQVGSAPPHTFPDVGPFAIFTAATVNIPSTAKLVHNTDVGGTQQSGNAAAVDKSGISTTVVAPTNVSMRVVPLTPTCPLADCERFDVSDVFSSQRSAGASSSWGVELSIASPLSERPVELEGCVIGHQGLAEPLPCLAPEPASADRVVCALSSGQLVALLAPNLLTNTTGAPEPLVVQCLPNGPPFYPLVVTPTSASIDNVIHRPGTTRLTFTNGSIVECYVPLSLTGIGDPGRWCVDHVPGRLLVSHRRLSARSDVRHVTLIQPPTDAALELYSDRDDEATWLPVAAIAAGSVRPRLAPRVKHAELLLSYILRYNGSDAPGVVSGTLVAVSPKDIVQATSRRTFWDSWCSKESPIGKKWRAPLTLTAQHPIGCVMRVTGTPAMIPASILEVMDNATCLYDDCVQVFAVFCSHRPDVGARRGAVLVVPVVVLGPVDVSAVSVTARVVCPRDHAQSSTSCVDMVTRARLERHPLRPGFTGASATLAADEIGLHYCRRPTADTNHDTDATQPRKKPTQDRSVPMEISDLSSMANSIMAPRFDNASDEDAGFLRPAPPAHSSVCLLANRPHMERAAVGPSNAGGGQRGGSNGQQQQRLGPFALCVTLNVTAMQHRTRGFVINGNVPMQELAEDVFVGFAVFVPPPMVQAIAVPPPNPLSIHALSESWWAFVATNLDVVHGALATLASGTSRASTAAAPQDGSRQLQATGWSRYPLRIVPFPRSVSSRDYMRRHKPHRLCYPPTGSSTSTLQQAPGSSVRHAMPLSAHSAAEVADAARDMYPTTRVDGAVVWLLRSRGAFYGECAVCATVDGVEVFVGVLSIPGPWYTASALPPSALASQSNQQTYELVSGHQIRLAFSVVAHSGAENLRSGLQLLRREEDRWLALIGTTEPQADAKGYDIDPLDNLVIGTPLHYEEITRPAASQDVDRVVTAVLTPTVPGMYLVCFAKGLAWDNTSKLASGQQRSPEGVALSSAVRRTLEGATSWIRQFDVEDHLPVLIASDAHTWVPMNAMHHSVGVAPVLGVNRTSTTRLPTLADVNVWTVLHVRAPMLAIRHCRAIRMEMSGPRVLMTLTPDAVKAVAGRTIVGWATACVQSEYSPTILQDDGFRKRDHEGVAGSASRDAVEVGLSDTLGHLTGVAVARSITSLADDSVTLSFLMTAKNLCGKRSVQLVAGWRRVARALRTPHRNKFAAPSQLDDSDADTHRVVWRTVGAIVELPQDVLDALHRSGSGSGSGVLLPPKSAETEDAQVHHSGTMDRATVRDDAHEEDGGAGGTFVPIDLDGLDDL